MAPLSIFADELGNYSLVRFVGWAAALTTAIASEEVIRSGTAHPTETGLWRH
ncbi:hypothetical protein [[Phormidium] sp. ETS-05]|uniref:hypothetical protein n=1 Tax=[Phormidium] sp. ETS-05 TaxID=222819 RepID=UPI0018EEEF75|nr:hypothetical protein [[Phormidium] sp. ETS-05]